MAITANLKSGYNGQIYGGPELSTTTYEPVSTISTSQTLQVIWAEKPSSVSYCFIEYTDSSTSKKMRGYIPQDYLTLTGGTPATKSLTSVFKKTSASQSIMYGPGDLGGSYNLRGTVSTSDILTVMATDGIYSFIEYVSINGKKRRGYVATNFIVDYVGSMATTFPTNCYGSGASKVKNTADNTSFFIYTSPSSFKTSFCVTHKKAIQKLNTIISNLTSYNDIWSWINTILGIVY
jgi:hypothetical protein